MKDHILAGQHKATKLWHGMFFSNHPTPSGCDRPILRFSTKQGFETEREAIEAMKKAFTPAQLNDIEVPVLTDCGS